MKQSASIYQGMAARTNGSIYIGVVGPVRTGKSTFIKRFMESQIIPHIDNAYRRDRATDELPQSGSGRTIMTAEPKFVPEEAVEIKMEDGVTFSARLIDCVGYMIPGAVGQFEGLSPRMVMTPWYDYEIPMTDAAEIGTKKVITDHSTVGIVVTTDGTVADIPREDYIEAEERVIRELQEIGKPFVVLLNSAAPDRAETKNMANEIAKKYQVTCMAMNCMELNETDIQELLSGLLCEFPMYELDIHLPSWVDALPKDHPLKNSIYQMLRQSVSGVNHISDLDRCIQRIEENELIDSTSVRSTDLTTGTVVVEPHLPRKLFYETLAQQCHLKIADDGDLMRQLSELSEAKTAYDRISQALSAARTNGYGIVMPSVEELTLEDPEIVRQGGRYGLRMKASAPSIHLIRADIETTVSPIVGNEKQSEEMVNYLLQEYQGDTGKIWQSNLFGRSLHEIVSEDLQAKVKCMPEDSQAKLREALERIINEGSGGLICIIL